MKKSIIIYWVNDKNLNKMNRIQYNYKTNEIN